jgi:hypothetical protein
MTPGQWKDANKLKTGNDMHHFQAVENSSHEERQRWMSIESSAAISWHISIESNCSGIFYMWSPSGTKRCIGGWNVQDACLRFEDRVGAPPRFDVGHRLLRQSRRVPSGGTEVVRG